MNPLLRSQFLDTWKHQWLPKITKAIKATLTEPMVKKIKPLIYDIEDGFDNTDGEDETFMVHYY